MDDVSKPLPKRPRVLLVGCIFTLVLLFTMVEGGDKMASIWIDALDEATDTSSASGALAFGTLALGDTLLMIPQLVLYGAGAILEIFGYALRNRYCTLAAAIVMCIALILRPVVGLVAIGPAVVLAFFGFAAQCKAIRHAQAEFADAQRRAREDAQLGNMIDALMGRKAPAAPDALLPDIPERKQNESQEDRLNRLSVQAQRWNAKK